MAYRARLPGAQAGARPRTLRGTRLARLSSPRHPLHRCLRIPDLQAGDDSLLSSSSRLSLPAAPGQFERYDCDYRRNGTANLFVFLDAHRSCRTVKVTDWRTIHDFAECIRDLVDVHYLKAERIRVVPDDLSTHSSGALYQAFPAPEAHRILRRLEFHYTPKHASWLNMVEIEIGVCAANASTAASATVKPSRPESLPGSSSATLSLPPTNGFSPLRTLAVNFGEPIQTLTKSHNHCAEPLVLV
jgi:hypothetical protein